MPPTDCLTIPGCGIAPVTIQAPEEFSLEVTVTVEMNSLLPAWTVSTPGCGSQITPVCIDCNVGVGGYVSIVNGIISIHVTDCTGICDDDNDSITVVFVIRGCLGLACADVDVAVIIYNPCVDISYFAITPITMPAHQCELFDSNCNFMHQPF
jgi:hypothetical protein